MTCPEDPLAAYEFVCGQRDGLSLRLERQEAEMATVRALTVDVLCEAADALVMLCCCAPSIAEIVPLVEPRLRALRSAALEVEPVSHVLGEQMAKLRDALTEVEDMVGAAGDTVAENGAAQAAVTTGRVAELEAELSALQELVDELRLFQAKAERMAELRISAESKRELALSVKEFIQGWVVVGEKLKEFDAREPARLDSVHAHCRQEAAGLTEECERLKESVARYKSLAEGSILESVSQKLADGLGDAEHPYGPQWERAGSRCINCGYLTDDRCPCPDTAVTQLWAVRRA